MSPTTRLANLTCSNLAGRPAGRKSKLSRCTQKNMLLVIEGIDGSGKRTQTDLLLAYANSVGVSATCFAFPQYGQNAFATAISAYLTGAYGSLDAISPYLASLLYAGDRFASRNRLLEALDSYEMVICDRYVPSNIAHQASKLDAALWPQFIEWLLQIECGIYQMPLPDINLFLDLPVIHAVGLVSNRRRPGDPPDIHEEDHSYLIRTRDVYDFIISRSICGSWSAIECLSHGELLQPLAIHANILRAIDDLWPEK